MEFKVNFSLKNYHTSQWSSCVQNNKFKSIMKNGYKGMATFIYIHKFFLQVLILYSQYKYNKKFLEYKKSRIDFNHLI